jgi:hypothetical protein
MSNKNQEQTQPETTEQVQEKVENIQQTAEVVQESFSTMYKAATKDVEKLGPLGRIFLSIVIILALLKLTPILDLLYYMIQVVVLPMSFLVALGVFSADTFNMTMGWVESTIDYFRRNREERGKTA